VRIVFLGNVADYSPGFLEALVRRAEDPDDPVSIEAVICPAARPGRRADLTFSAKRRLGDAFDRIAGLPVPDAIRERATEGGGVHRRLQRLAHRGDAPIWWPTTLREPGLDDLVAGLGADIGVVAGLDRIVREPLLSALPPLYNVHPSLLPEFRGPMPEFWQLEEGAERAGVTIHRIDPGVDTGPIVLQQGFAIEPWFDAEALIAESVAVGTRLVDELIDTYPACDRAAREQTGGSYQPVPEDAMARVPFERTAKRAFDRARAFGFGTPLRVDVESAAWRAGDETSAVDPSASTTMLELFEPVPHVDAPSRTPGSVAATPTGGAVVWCATGALEFRRVVASPSPIDSEADAR
jgi:methionyl-tRNA formyltransferase